MRFPNANTIWSFREALKKTDVVDALFARFDAALREAGFLTMSGHHRPTIVAVPNQRNSIEEKKAIKEGCITDVWKEKPAKIAQRIVTRAGW